MRKRHVGNHPRHSFSGLLGRESWPIGTVPRESHLSAGSQAAAQKATIVLMPEPQQSPHNRRGPLAPDSAWWFAKDT